MGRRQLVHLSDKTATHASGTHTCIVVCSGILLWNTYFYVEPLKVEGTIS